MISVQNHLQQLNGNKLLIFFLIVSSISSFSSETLSLSNKLELSIYTASPTPNKGFEDSVLRKPEVFDLDYGLKSNPIKIDTYSNRIHNIAVILPFHIDQIPLGQYEDDTTKQLSPDSKYAMDFYLGCQMAREKFRSDNLQTNVYFLDDRNDSATTVSLFAQKPFPNVDFIIGPLYAKNMIIAADYGKANQIPIVSPIINTLNINKNPYYFNGVASLKTQYSFILDHVKSNFPGKTIEVLYDGQDSTAENIDIFKSIANRYFSYSTVKYTSLQSWSDAAKSVFTEDTLSEKVIIIYSYKDTYVKSIIAKLKTIKNHLQIFTTSCTKNTKSLTDSKNLNSIYTVYPFNTENPNFTLFAPRFEERFKKKPTETVNQAYDLMMHIFSMMDKGQPLQDNIYNYAADFNNTQTKFQFKPMLNNSGTPDYYDNTFLYLYKYVNGTFILATP